MGAPEPVPARFAPSARVRVRRADSPGHVRTPWYCRGHAGVIERICGNFANPEELAYNRDGLPAQPLYRVRFICRDLCRTTPATPATWSRSGLHDSTADMRYMELPLRPAGTGGLTEDELAQLITRDSLIGVAFANAPAV